MQQLWILATTFVALATINATLYILFIQQARQLLPHHNAHHNAQRIFNLFGGSLLALAAIWTLTAKRIAH